MKSFILVLSCLVFMGVNVLCSNFIYKGDMDIENCDGLRAVWKDDATTKWKVVGGVSRRNIGKAMGMFGDRLPSERLRNLDCDLDQEEGVMSVDGSGLDLRKLLDELNEKSQYVVYFDKDESRIGRTVLSNDDDEWLFDSDELTADADKGGNLFFNYTLAESSSLYTDPDLVTGIILIGGFIFLSVGFFILMSAIQTSEHLTDAFIKDDIMKKVQ